MSGWPSGLRRQTQELTSFLSWSILVHLCGRGFESHFWHHFRLVVMFYFILLIFFVSKKIRPVIIFCKMPRPGIEPGTFRSSVWRSPNWAIAAWNVSFHYHPKRYIENIVFTLHIKASKSKMTFSKDKPHGFLFLLFLLYEGETSRGKSILICSCVDFANQCQDGRAV